MTVDEIRELIRLGETGITELEVQRGENRVRIRRGSGKPSRSAFAVSPASASAVVPAAPSGSASLTACLPNRAAASAPEDSLVLVKSPIVGTFYEAASPEAPPFVRIGEHVSPARFSASSNR